MASGDDYQTIWLPNTVMRERSRVPVAKISAAELINYWQGRNELPFIVPKYTDHTQEGRPHYAVTRKQDWDRVKDGYACPDCLVKFPTYREDCILCDWRRDPARDLIDQIHDYWLPYEGRTSGEILKESHSPAAA